MSIALPVTADGTCVLDANDVILAECFDPDGPLTWEECVENARRIADALNGTATHPKPGEQRRSDG